MPKLIYVDEQDDQRRTMVRAAIMSGEFAEGDVKSLDPLPDLEDMLDRIQELHPEVIITDYRLTEYKAGVKYSGIDLVAAIQKRHKSFPCFVTTGFATDAAGEAASVVDINTIYAKIETQVTGANNPLSFFKRVRLKVEAYTAYTQQLETEHQVLRSKLQVSNLTPVEVERLLIIDGELEAMLGAHHSLPAELKRAALEPLNQIVEKAERFLSDLERIYPEDESNVS